MTAKEYLNQAYWLDRRIDSKLEQLSALKDMATKTTSIMSDDVVSPYPQRAQHAGCHCEDHRYAGRDQC